MKKLKLIMMTLVMCLITMSMASQTKVEQKESFKTELKTFKVEFYNGYYRNTLKRAYQYPTIKSGYYTVGFNFSYENLITLYEELINISKSSDGEYRLSIRMKNIHGVKKVGDKIFFKCLYYGSTNYKPYYSYTKKIKIKNLENDLQIIKEKFINYNNE